MDFSLQRRVVCALAILALCSCGGKSSSPAAPTPPSRDGNWRGTTSQNLPVTFTVAGNTVSAISVNITATYLNASCTYTTGTSQTATIGADGRFSIAIGGGTISTTLTGSFSSGTSANGTIEAFSISGLACGNTLVIGTPVSQAAKTWQATKQ